MEQKDLNILLEVVGVSARVKIEPELQAKLEPKVKSQLMIGDGKVSLEVWNEEAKTLDSILKMINIFITEIMRGWVLNKSIEIDGVAIYEWVENIDLDHPPT